jgi:hypothetical protein
VQQSGATAADAALAGQEALLPMVWQQLPGGRIVPVPLQDAVRAFILLPPDFACVLQTCGSSSIQYI